MKKFTKDNILDSIFTEDDIDITPREEVKYTPPVQEVIPEPEPTIIEKPKIKVHKGKLGINQSLINKLYKQGEELNRCNYYIKRVFIDKDVLTPTSAPMKAGLFGESLMIGSSADGTQFLIDRNRRSCTQKEYYEDNFGCAGCIDYENCKQTADEVKIRTQADIFKKMCEEMDIFVEPDVNTQVKVYKEVKGEKDFILNGTIDLFPFLAYIDDNYYMCLSDIKFTGNIQSSFGYMNWSDPDKTDYFQLDYYYYLLKDFDFSINKHLTEAQKLLIQFAIPYIQNNLLYRFFWVFDYKPKLEDMENVMRPVPYEFSSIVQGEIEQVVRGTIDYIKTNDSLHLWEDRQMCLSCKQCPFKDTCEEYYNNDGKYSTGWKYNRNANYEAGDLNI